jgi:HEXXH motif-containing protein
MVPHALTDEAFATLAAGRPSAATIEVLRRSQLSKHLLLLREIARAVPTSGYADLAAAERVHPAPVRRLLSDPLFGVWAAGCLAALHRGESEEEAGVSHLAALAATATAELQTAERGTPRQGTTGREAGQATAESSDRFSTSRHPGQATAGYEGRRLRASHGGLVVDVRLEDVDPLRARLGLTPTGPLSDAEAARWQELLAEAWCLLVSRHRADAETLAAVLEVIVPVEPDPAARGISATSADAFGAVAMSLPADAAALAVGLLHETWHSLLNAVHYLFDLHRDPDTQGYSPWRDDPRPASGVLHGAYAYLAVTRFWRAEAGTGCGVAAFEFARWRSAVAAAARGLLAGGRLTAAGERFAGALLDEVRPWLDEVVPGDAGRLGEGANTDHYLRWRLRNLDVEPADVQVLADAWRRGQALPRVAVRSRLVPAPRRALESSARLDLAHAWVAGRQPGGRATTADVAYLRGEYGTALDAYRKMILKDWAGIALVGGWDEVEVLAAVYRALDQPELDVAALAAWISGERPGSIR